MIRGAAAAAAADIVRPSHDTGCSPAAQPASRLRSWPCAADGIPAGFARLQGAVDADPERLRPPAAVTIHRAAVIVAAKGGTIAEITIGDLLAELLDAEAYGPARPLPGMQRASTGRCTDGDLRRAPATLRQLRTTGQRTPEELIDRYHLACQPGP